MAILAFNAIFSDLDSVEINEVTYPIKITSRAGLKYIEIDEFKFMEQNPNKSSKWAKMAQNGTRIIWIFKGRSYHARVVEGKFTLLKK